MNGVKSEMYLFVHLSVFLFQSAAAIVEPPQTDPSECRPDIPGISDRRTG